MRAFVSSTVLAQQSKISSGELVEGSKPDGDGDQDDLQSSTVTANTASLSVGNIGSNINVYA